MQVEISRVLSLKYYICLNESLFYNNIIFQAEVGYDIISKERIGELVETGNFVHLPFFSNCCYVAFKAENIQNVSKTASLKLMILKRLI